MKEWRVYPDTEIVILQIIFTLYQGEEDRYNLMTTISPKLVKTTTFEPHLRANYEATTGHYFVTCADITKMGSLSLMGYASAYDITTWIFIGVYVVSSAFIVFRINIRLQFSQTTLFPIAILLEQGCLGFGSMSIKSQSIFEAWLLVGIVLSNIYKGDNITSLTAPLSLSKLNRFDQLISKNFAYFCSDIATKTAHSLDMITQLKSEFGVLSQLVGPDQ